MRKRPSSTFITWTLATVALVIFSHPAFAVSSNVSLPEHVLPILTKAIATDETTLEASQSLTLTIVLKRERQPEFERYLHELYDSRSPNFHRFLTQRQIADRFGPAQADYGAVQDYFESNGFRLIRGSSNRLTLTFRVTRHDAERALKTSIKDYRLGARRFYANASAPELPVDLAPRVAAVVGMSNLARPQHATMVIHALFCRAAKLLCR